MSKKTKTEEVNSKLEELHIKINSSVFGILAILYETGIIKRVNIKKIMDLYGVDANINFNEFENDYVEFDDPAFLQNYNHYKKIQYSQKIINKQRRDIEHKFEDKYERNPKITIH